ncbi:MAG: peroxidase-related enzyme [Candidatus Obscuribacterales bacterium]|nr:peroxidase-related enzyme [Candidatus Obscuribacterales bacterium]
MSRIAAISPESATGKVKDIYDAINKKLGKVPNIFQHMANSPAVLEGYMSFSRALDGGVLPPKLRELIAIAVAEINVCQYCLSAHMAIAKSIGMTEQELKLARDQRSDNDKWNAALKFVRQMVTTDAEMKDDDIAQVKEAGFTDAEIAEIIAVVALNQFTNYFNLTVQPEIDFPKIETAFPV